MAKTRAQKKVRPLTDSDSSSDGEGVPSDTTPTQENLIAEPAEELLVQRGTVEQHPTSNKNTSLPLEDTPSEETRALAEPSEETSATEKHQHNMDDGFTLVPQKNKRRNTIAPGGRYTLHIPTPAGFSTGQKMQATTKIKSKLGRNVTCRLHPHKVSIYLENDEDRMLILEDGFLAGLGLGKPTNPTHMSNITHGLIHGVPTDLTEGEILDYLRPQGASSVRRLRATHKHGDQLHHTALTKVAVHFCIATRPEHVSIGPFTFKVSAYNSPPTQCHNCLRFGHSAKFCRSLQTCRKCSGRHHFRDCTAPIPKCPNCSGSHPANFANCPARQRACQIQAIANKKGLSIRDARHLVDRPIDRSHEQTKVNSAVPTTQTTQAPHPDTKSYSQAVRTPPPTQSQQNQVPKRPQKLNRAIANNTQPKTLNAGEDPYLQKTRDIAPHSRKQREALNANLQKGVKPSADELRELVIRLRQDVELVDLELQTFKSDVNTMAFLMVHLIQALHDIMKPDTPEFHRLFKVRSSEGFRVFRDVYTSLAERLERA